MRILPLFCFLLAGCPWVGPGGFEENVQDADGDGVISDRFGGDDCDDSNPSIGDCDQDNDGFLSTAVGGDDCDDTLSSVNPGATEVCSGRDDDCDALVDDQDDSVTGQQLFWFDGDGDGVGTDTVQVTACEAPAGYVAAGSTPDCDDSDPSTRPGVIEDCSDADRNCDGDPYAGTAGFNWYEDNDGDGFGGVQSSTSCVAPNPTDVQNDGDCDDSNAAITTAPPWYVDADGDGVGTGPAIAACQAPAGTVAIDGDCNDADPDSTDSVTLFMDRDGDGFGYDDPDDPTDDAFLSCGVPTGFVTNGTDCDDTDDRYNPNAAEICNGRDDDCDGAVDNNALDADTWLEDRDGDGFGNDNAVVLSCSPDTSTVPLVTVGGDCNDQVSTTFPGAPEICYDLTRQDCLPVELDDCDGDGSVDADHGGDDCDDADPAVRPGALEICDGVDNDCNNLVDDDDPAADLSTATDWYPDADQDGYGSGSPIFACSPPSGSVAVDGDCDDTDPSSSPAGSELCDGADNDCNGTVDDADPSVATLWWADGDGDSWGAGTAIAQCDPPSNTSVQRDGDCDDALPDSFPGATEFCDGVDNDCNGLVDDNPANGGLFFVDNDADGYGAPNASVLACSAASGVVTNGDDCNDADPDSHPGAVEICDDGLRQDCTTADLQDCDGDGFVDANDGGTDCDDENTAVLPGAVEICDGLDNDCNGLLDDADPGVDLSSSTDWYPDADLDGFGDANTPTPSCSQPAGHVLDATDCDDGQAAINPAADEVCDSIDNDCDGFADDLDPEGPTDPSLWSPDADLDGFGSFATVVSACIPPTVPAVWVLDATDCNDVSPLANPGEPEVCDGVDNDCDGAIDDLDSDVTDQQLWYADADGDGYVRLASFVLACQPSADFRADPGLPEDCNDSNAAVSPGGVEVCDGLDNDCDGLTDTDDPDIDSAWYIDADADGFGEDASVVQSCTPVAGAVQTGGDCDDADPAINPTTVWYLDDDRDGYGVAGSTTQECEPPFTSTWSLVAGDCDDTNDRVNPGAAEVCIPLNTDDDCDGDIDNADSSLAGGLTHYADTDGDGFGFDNDDPRNFCAVGVPAGWEPAINGLDCDDGNSAIYPGADEIWYDGIDSNCDGGDDYDQDGDGFCSRDDGGSCPIEKDDCNDLQPLINPDADDIWYDGIDSDCDGANDYDQDGDGVSVLLPAGFPTAHSDPGPLDCDDRPGLGAARMPRTLSWPPDASTPAVCGGTSATLQDLLDCSCDVTISASTGASSPDRIRVQGQTVTLVGPTDPTGLDLDWTADCASGSPSGFCLGFDLGGKPIIRVSSAPSEQFPTMTIEGRLMLDKVVVHDGENAIGAGLRIDDGQFAQVSDSVFAGNVAYSAGGAIHIGAGADLVLDGAELLSNLSTSQGGGVFASPESTLTITDSLFQDNQGTRSSAIALDQATLWLNATDFLDNGTPVISGSTTPAGITGNDVLLDNRQSGGAPMIELFTSPGAAWFTDLSISSPDTLLSSEVGVICNQCLFSQPGLETGFGGGPGLAFYQTYSSLTNSLLVSQSAPIGILYDHTGGELVDSVVITTHSQAVAVVSSGTAGSPFGPKITNSALFTPASDPMGGEPFFGADESPYACLGTGCALSTSPDTNGNFTPTGSLASLFYRVRTQLPIQEWYPRLIGGSNPLRGAGASGGDIGFYPSNTGFNADLDTDGMSDLWELDHGVNSPSGDPDGDGLSNLQEYTNTRTDPSVADTDGDGLPDGGTPIGEGTLGTDPLDWDHDDDALTDGDEILIWSTNPLAPDTDGDGLPDGFETTGGNISDMNICLASDPTLPDSDGDGLNDLAECSLTWEMNCGNVPSDPLAVDSDGDGASDSDEFTNNTCPLDPTDF